MIGAVAFESETEALGRDRRFAPEQPERGGLLTYVDSTLFMRTPGKRACR